MALGACRGQAGVHRRERRDATLRELIVRRPASLRELIDVRGIGPSFCERHGESLLRALASLGAGAGGGQPRLAATS